MFKLGLKSKVRIGSRIECHDRVGLDFNLKVGFKLTSRSTRMSELDLLSEVGSWVESWD